MQRRSREAGLPRPCRRVAVSCSTQESVDPNFIACGFTLVSSFRPSMPALVSPIGLDLPLETLLDWCRASQCLNIEVPAGPLHPGMRCMRQCDSFPGSAVPAGSPLARNVFSGLDPGVAIRSSRFLVLHDQIRSCQVTRIVKRLAPEGFVLRISGIEEIVVLDPVIAGGHSLHRANR